MKTWDKPGFSPYFTQWKHDFTGFAPGTNPVCPWDSERAEGDGTKVTEKAQNADFRRKTEDSRQKTADWALSP